MRRRGSVCSMPSIFSHAGAVAESGVHPGNVVCPSPHRLVLSDVQSFFERGCLCSDDLVREGHVGKGRSGLRLHVAGR